MIANTLLSAAGSFGLESGAAMIAKGWREYHRCDRATNDEDRRDAGINCAITIWHVNDWIWAAIAKFGRRDAELAEYLGVYGEKISKDDLVSWAVKTCPELEICQAICDGSKHVGLRGLRSTEMIASDDRADREVQNLVVIEENGNERPALSVYRAALDFWTNEATNFHAMK
ncbi:MAG: hypothetical protein EON54_11650 [Alcaligenaceae bacterium]|nr:MAG: hypothetical protein EON54_11650 [Alcaligenaceae bacterium]